MQNLCSLAMEAHLKGPISADDPILIKHLQSFYLTPPSSLRYNLSRNPTYRRGSLASMWLPIYEVVKVLFDDTTTGFFVEAGALDGDFLSNTLWLEKYRGWTGLLIEPGSKNFQDMTYKRRKSWLSHSCLSSSIYPKKVNMVATERKTGLKDFEDGVLRGGTHEVGSYSENNPWDYASLEKLLKIDHFISQCFPLQSYLLALNQTVVDFLSLDTQGTEISIFDTIPLDKIYIRSVVIEHERSNFDNNFVKKMNKKGFSLLRADGAPDYFFVNSKETKLIQKYVAKLNMTKGDYFQEVIDEGLEIVFS